jgi:crotonobetainyl-CoA:carnitine CoA-transferase CaiB-like acyl-CoA transferase
MGSRVLITAGWYYMALGLVSGVLSARRTGFGQDIDVNLYDTALFNLSYLSVWTLNGDYTPARSSRSAHASLVPCQLYKTSDGCIYIMCNKEKFWITLCEEIGRADLLSDSRLVDFSARLKHRDYLTEAIARQGSCCPSPHTQRSVVGSRFG